jgi:hypothetical protein
MAELPHPPRPLLPAPRETRCSHSSSARASIPRGETCHDRGPLVRTDPEQYDDHQYEAIHGSIPR